MYPEQFQKALKEATDNECSLSLEVPIREESTVGEISDAFCEMIRDLQAQDILYGKESLEHFAKKLMPMYADEGDTIEDMIACLEDPLTIESLKELGALSDLHYIDLETDTLWSTKELYDKHMQYKFREQIDKILKNEKEKNETLVIHGTYDFVSAYSILKNGFYFQNIESYEQYDEDENLRDINVNMLVDTTMPIPSKDATDYVLNYSYAVNDRVRGSRYSVILRVPDEKIPEADAFPDYYRQAGDYQSFLDRKYVVAVIDKDKRRVITSPSKELDEEFEIAWEERKETKQKGYDELAIGTYIDVDELERLLNIINNPDIDAETKEKAEKEYDKLLENIMPKDDIEINKSELGKREDVLASLEDEEKLISKIETLIDQQKEGQDIGEE